MRTHTLPTVLLLATLTTAGCSSTEPAAQQPVGAASTSTTTTAVPSPTPTTLSRKEAAAAYLKLVAPSNRVASTLNHVMLADTIDLDAARKAAAAYATSLREFSLGLQKTPWPADVQPIVNEFVDELATTIVDIRALSRARSVEEAITIWNEASRKANSKAELIRQKLGLAEAPAG